jgi:hypothetical protein
MLKRLPHVLAALLAGGTTLAVGVHAVPKSVPSCTYSTYSQVHDDAIEFGSNYIDVSLTLWQVPSGVCAQWTNHDWGDTEVEVDYQLGKATNWFLAPSDQHINMFGWMIHPSWGSAFPENGNPFQSGMAGPNAGWEPPAGGEYGDYATTSKLGGTDGDTNLEQASGPLGGAECQGDNGAALMGLSDGAPGYWSESEVQIGGSGGGWKVVPYFNYDPVPPGPNC